MVYSEELAERVRDELASVPKLTERAMFGGVAFMVAGNMACGVNGDDVLVRIDPTLHHDALTRPHAREMDFTGRSMKGFVAVGPGEAVDDGELELWVKLGVTYARSLPPKAAKKKKKAAPAKKVSAAKKATRKVTGKPVKRLAKKASPKKKAVAKKKVAKKKLAKKAVKKARTR